MVPKFKKIITNQLIAGSAILFIGSMVANFANYLYHLLMGRMLGPASYGELTSLISMAYIVSIFSITLSTTVVKFVTKYKVKKGFGYVFELFWQLTKRFLVVALVIFLVFYLLRNEINNFLHLTNSLPVVVLGLWLAVSFIGFTNDSILRGLFNFKFLTFNIILSSFLKVFAAVVLVKLGWMVSGALGAIFLAGIFSCLVSFWPLRFLWQYKKDKVRIPWQELLAYSGPVLVANLGLTSLYSSDLILVKHFFSPFESGLYASLSVIGKIVFFASGTVPVVMFPLVSERFENGKGYKIIFVQSFWLVAVASAGLTILYFLFPKLMISLLYGNSYLEAAPFLGYFAVFIGIYSLGSLLVNYFLSVGRVNLVLLPFFAAISQIILIWFFHNSILQVIQICLLITALLLFSLLLYYFQSEKRQ